MLPECNQHGGERGSRAREEREGAGRGRREREQGEGAVWLLLFFLHVLSHFQNVSLFAGICIFTQSLLGQNEYKSQKHHFSVTICQTFPATIDEDDSFSALYFVRRFRSVTEAVIPFLKKYYRL